MRISRIGIKNFRNFANLDVELDEHAVIVGANGVGKSNLLHALRLVLDPSLADAYRSLRPEDFWDGLPRPLTKDSSIEIVVELADFEASDEQLASLAEHLIKPEPMAARLTYVFRAKANASATPTPEDFEFFVFGGDREDNRVGHDVRRRLPLDVFHALRDVEADLASWRRSPLRPLLERAWATLPMGQREALAAGIDAATNALTGTQPLADLESTLTAAVEKIGGKAAATDVQLGISPTSSEAVIRIVRLLIDEGRRTASEASLGLANVLYLTLKLLELRHLVTEHYRDHTFVAIEEPEAHLHPHLQRQVFRSFLRVRPHLTVDTDKPLDSLPTTILLTTHSPHLASIAPLRSLVLLQRSGVPQPKGKSVPATIARSLAKASFTIEEVRDLERFIEVTRAEMLFASAVILVEGDTELYLLPRIAELSGNRLDELGITVCPVGGTHFQPHVLLLRALGIPFAVVTDGDPDAEGGFAGHDRVNAILAAVLPKVTYDAIDPGKRIEAARVHGLFVGDHTFEIDLLRSGREAPICTALRDLAAGPTAMKRAEAWLADSSTIEVHRLLADIERIGKGRFAQRLTASLPKRSEVAADLAEGPAYVIDAIKYVAQRLQGT